MAIQGFACKVTERFFVEGKGHHGQGWANVSKVAIRKLNMLHAAAELTDLRAPPGNRLEALIGDREGQHSIRINGQWRVVFEWTHQGPINVEIVDYH